MGVADGWTEKSHRKQSHGNKVTEKSHRKKGHSKKSHKNKRLTKIHIISTYMK